MIKYTATFSDGTTITRKSERQYAVAWRATWTCPGSEKVSSESGFSYSAQGVSAYKPKAAWVHRGMSSKARAAAMAENAAYLDATGYKVEIVEARA